MYRSLLRAGAHALASLGVSPGEVEVVVMGGGARLHFSGPPQPNESHQRSAPVPESRERPEIAPASWRWFSPAEEAVVRACLDDAWHTAEQLAVAARQPYGTEFKAVLRNLVSRCVLESAPSRGYKISRADDGPVEPAQGPERD